MEILAWCIIIAFLVGAIVSLLIGGLINRFTSATGIFVINYSDPEDEFVKLQFDNKEDLQTKKKIKMKIKRQ